MSTSHIALAQEAQPAPAEPATADETAPEGQLVTASNARIYEPAYFAQYAPRNALDMVSRIPGFQISGGNGGQRGLGEATQNVLVNGERYSGKSDGVAAQLQRIPAGDVVRIELVDGASLDIAGLSGQVANVIVASDRTSGQFRWNTGFRAHNTEAQLYGGEISLKGKEGALEYTVALSNNNDRFGADGPVVIRDGTGALIEEQYAIFSGKYDNPKLATNLTYRFSVDTIANLNLSYGEDFYARSEPEIGIPVIGPVRTRDAQVDEDGPEYEIGGDLEFPFGPGKLKLIGLERFERDNFASVVVDSFDDGSPALGSRFTQTNEIGERIGRFEYRWGLWGGDWQLSGEAAFNRLNRASGLFVLDNAGAFAPIPFPSGTGGVTEDRYESILSFSDQVTDTLALQATIGGEISTIEQTGTAANSRTFQRPKGSVSLTWKPRSDFNISVELRRRVGQLSFGDFLASVQLNNDNQNAGNNQLVPDQSWNLNTQINKNFGAWGSARLQVNQAWFEDFVDYFPLPTGGEARGNIGNARRTHVEFTGTLKLDPIGWKGAQFDIQAIKRWMNVADPFTGLDRGFSYDLNDLLEISYRHDIPGSDFAYGAGLFTNDQNAYSRRFEIGRESEGPVFLDAFVEHKDVFGLTVRATYANILNARNDFTRTVFDGPRPDAPVRFTELADRRIGPIFRFSVSGNF